MKRKMIKDIRLEGWETIHQAAYCGNYDILLDDLNIGVCVNSISSNLKSSYYPFLGKKYPIYFSNVTPLYLAAQKGHTKCVQLLISRGADPTIKTKNNHTNDSCTALSVALYFNNFRCYKIMKRRNKYERTLLGDITKNLFIWPE